MLLTPFKQRFWCENHHELSQCIVQYIYQVKYEFLRVDNAVSTFNMHPNCWIEFPVLHRNSQNTIIIKHFCNCFCTNMLVWLFFGIRSCNVLSHFHICNIFVIFDEIRNLGGRGSNFAAIASKTKQLSQNS